MKKLVNFVLFQAGWFALVLSAEHSLAWLAFAFVLCSLVVHLVWISDNPRRDALLLASVPPLGLLLDTALAQGDVLYYRGAPLLGVFAPGWIFAMWAIFAMTFHSSMSWMQARYGIAALFGAIGAPLSYAGAARVSAVGYFDPTWRSVLLVALAWGLAMPLFLWISARCANFGGASRLQSSKAA